MGANYGKIDLPVTDDGADSYKPPSPTNITPVPSNIKLSPFKESLIIYDNTNLQGLKVPVYSTREVANISEFAKINGVNEFDSIKSFSVGDGYQVQFWEREDYNGNTASYVGDGKTIEFNSSPEYRSFKITFLPGRSYQEIQYNINPWIFVFIIIVIAVVVLFLYNKNKKNLGSGMDSRVNYRY